MLVSVIVAAYNCEEKIERCLESLINQSIKNIEIIVCNDCSTDRTFDVLNNFNDKNGEKIIILQNNRNMGAAFTRNRCLELALGKYIAIQDADDYSDLNRLAIQTQILNENPQISFLSTGLFKLYDNGIKINCIPEKRCPTSNDFLFGLPFMHATTMFRTDVLKAVNGYRVAWETKRGQDYDLFMRLYASGYTGMNINDILYYYDYDQTSPIKTKYTYRLGESIIRYKGFKSMNLLPKGYLYILKPLILGLIPPSLLERARKSQIIKNMENKKND